MLLILGSIAITFSILTHCFWQEMKYRTQDRFSLQLTEALETIVSSLRAGTSFLQALQMSVENAEDPFAGEFKKLFQEYKMGMPLEKALDHLAQRLPLEDIQSLVASVQIAQTSGGRLATVLDKLSHNLREQHQLKRRVQALASQGKLQGWILGLIPFVILGFMYFMDPEIIHNFLNHSIGQTIFAIVILAEVFAFWMIQCILKIKV